MKDIKDYSDMSDVFAEEEIDEETQIRPYEVDCLPNDYNIFTLISMIERGYMRIPSFQRNYVWKKDMASRFIESILIGLPIPQIFLFERERNNFLVIDGQQRMVTIYLYRKQRFPKNDKARNIIRKHLALGQQIPDEELASDDFEDFKLKLNDSKNELNLLQYDTLSIIKGIDFKGIFDFNRTIRTITIKQITPSEDDSSMFEIFSRLNSGGVMLKPQEIRMSIYYSDFYEKMTSEMNLNTSWRSFLGKMDPDLHMSDIEVLVRAFAMLDMSKEYKAPLKGFLNSFSKKATTFNREEIELREAVFSFFWESCEKLPKNVFKNEKNKFVISFFESVFVATCEKILSEGLNSRKISYESLQRLKRDDIFIDYSQGSTASATSVSNRLDRARSIIVLE